MLCIEQTQIPDRIFQNHLDARRLRRHTGLQTGEEGLVVTFQQESGANSEAGVIARCAVYVFRFAGRAKFRSLLIKIHQRGVQWKQGVVITPL